MQWREGTTPVLTPQTVPTFLAMGRRSSYDEREKPWPLSMARVADRAVANHDQRQSKICWCALQKCRSRSVGPRGSPRSCVNIFKSSRTLPCINPYILRNLAHSPPLPSSFLYNSCSIKGSAPSGKKPQVSVSDMSDLAASLSSSKTSSRSRSPASLA